MKTICHLPLPEGSRVISHIMEKDGWILFYLCPNDEIKIFHFDLFNHILSEIIDIEQHIETHLGHTTHDYEIPHRDSMAKGNEPLL